MENKTKEKYEIFLYMLGFMGFSILITFIINVIILSYIWDDVLEFVAFKMGVI